MRPTWADVDLTAVAHNVGELLAIVAPADLCVVVKADGYGHGAIPVGRAAVAAGADWLAVALVDEGKALRLGGIDVPILVLSEAAPTEIREVVSHHLTPTVYSIEGLAAAGAAAARADVVLDVHLKIDTGMGRVGAPPTEALDLAHAIDAQASLNLGAVWTHCAVADSPDDPGTNRQLDVYDQVLQDLGAHGVDVPMRHAGNSAVALGHPRAHYDMVRCGLAAYGLAPALELAHTIHLKPVLTLRSEVAFVKRVAAGDRISYGLNWTAAHETTIATVPIGYADGVRRRSNTVGGHVLIAGRRCPMVGTVTMDQLMVDCGDIDVSRGDEVVIIGRQGDEEIGVDEWADRLDTISWEIVCAIGERVTRRYL